MVGRNSIHTDNKQTEFGNSSTELFLPIIDRNYYIYYDEPSRELQIIESDVIEVPAEVRIE